MNPASRWDSVRISPRSSFGQQGFEPALRNCSIAAEGGEMMIRMIDRLSNFRFKDTLHELKAAFDHLQCLLMRSCHHTV